STVLMTVIPARVAGVKEIVLVTPAGAGGRIEPVVLAAARIAGVTEGYRIGGAQAVAALAYGTSLIRKVDKIVGPGNIYVELDDALTLADLLAPEHLELLVAAPTALLPRVRHAGAVFLGGHTPEVVGDYVAGPNHVLPTAGTARFASPLSTEDFVKRSSVIEYSRGGLRAAAPHLKTLTRIEGLAGHGSAAALRLDRDGGRGA